MSDRGQELAGYVTTKYAARELGLTRRRIQQLCKTELLKARVLADRWLIEETDLQRYRAERRR